jgi:hypothetical protein
MKKITLKISAFLLLSLFALQVQAQFPNVWTENGTYKIGTYNVTPQLFMTINPSTLAVEWQEELPGNDPTQVWTITDHRTPASGGLMEIWATIPGVGNFTMTTSSEMSSHPTYVMSVRAGDPMSVTSGDYSGLDQFQRRRTTGFSGPGNNALFFRTTAGTNSRFGAVPSAAGTAVQFDGGGIDPLEFFLLAPLSTEAFDASSIFIANPVRNELSVKGLTANINKVTIHSLLGQEVFSKKLNGESSLSLDISSLKSGMYIVDFIAENGSLTKKIVKQ